MRTPTASALDNTSRAVDTPDLLNGFGRRGLERRPKMNAERDDRNRVMGRLADSWLFSAPPQPTHSPMYRWTDTWTSVLSFDCHNKPVYYDLHFVQGSPKSLEVGLSQDI